MPRKCIEEGCDKSPVYNYPGETIRIYCRQHAKQGMLPAGQTRCQDPDCEKYALYNYEGETAKLYCQTHAKPGMTNVKKKTCKFRGCSTQPYYNNPGNKTGLYCIQHALKGMINVCSKTCKDCRKIPSYNLPGEKNGLYCKEHCKEGMVNVRGNMCKCGKQASFAEPGTNKPTHCATHKLVGMINVRKKYCRFAGCTKTALFGNDGERLSCASHKEDNMLNETIKHCLEEGCKVMASFGIDKPTHCAKHKDSLMKQLVGYICKTKNCPSRASFNYKNLKPIYCGKHRKGDMIDVISLTCKNKKCSTTATYGYPGSSPEFCATHRPKDTKLNPTKRCIIKACNDLALYGVKYAVRCEKHMRDNDFNCVERECKSCGLLNVLDRENLCRYCHPNTLKIVRLAKQKEIEALFKYQKLEYVSTDKTIDSGDGVRCGLERPDFLFEGVSHYVVVEIDEDQHRSRACECEQTRMVNISQSLGMPTIFLRYNPDRYKANGEITDTTKARRHKTLVDWLCKLMVLEFDEVAEHGFLSVIHLYFDDYNPRKVVWETILKHEE